jgi:hypothetical protein
LRSCTCFPSWICRRNSDSTDAASSPAARRARTPASSALRSGSSIASPRRLRACDFGHQREAPRQQVEQVIGVAASRRGAEPTRARRVDLRFVARKPGIESRAEIARARRRHPEHLAIDGRLA